MNGCLDHAPQLEEELLSSLGKDGAEISEESRKSVDWIRSELCKEVACLIGVNSVDGEPDRGRYSSSKSGRVLYSSAVGAKDPAAEVAKWIFEGTPAAWGASSTNTWCGFAQLRAPAGRQYLGQPSLDPL